MKKAIFSKIFVVLFVLVAPLVLSGCFPSVSTGGPEIHEKSKFVKGAIVANFPAVPLYPESTIIESYSSANNNFGASAVTKDDIEKVIEFYQKAFGELGWENTLSRQSTNNYLFEIRNAKDKGTVIVNTAADGKSTAITVSVSPR